ncbi:E3 ubiquitin-protein ligase Siah2-like [Euwallacea similis]|uniref:E3 ubiquitin-protein ligase Siah2-like n=1 Tax=Euwallacea similis TaxID=1736056 RepID=UPI00344DB764
MSGNGISASFRVESPLCLEDCILSEMICLKCKNSFVEKIFHCERGHSICSKCFRLERYPVDNTGQNRMLWRLSVDMLCRICGAYHKASRTHHLERIMSMLTYPCKFFGRGCQRRIALKKLKNHEEECEAFKLRCPLHLNFNCPFVGTKVQTVFHCQLFHGYYIFVGDTIFKHTFLPGVETKFSSSSTNIVIQTNWLYYYHCTLFKCIIQLCSAYVRLRITQLGPPSEKEFIHTSVIKFYSSDEELVETFRHKCSFAEDENEDWLKVSLQVLRRSRYFKIEFVEEFNAFY